MTTLQLVLEPDPPDMDPAEYADLVRELIQLLRRELALPVTVRSGNVAAPREVARGDAVALATLILAIPQAALAMHDLAGRLKLKDCLQRVAMRARTRRARVTWRIAGEHMALAGDREPTLDEVLDELERSEDPPQTG